MKYTRIERLLSAVNLLFFQWFFLRAFVQVEEDDTVTAVGLHFGALPLTGWIMPARLNPLGWRNDYVYVTRNRKPRLLWVRFL